MQKRDLVLGAAAGAAATWLMDVITTKVYELEPKEVQERENRARGGRIAYETAAEKLADLLGTELDDDQRKDVGSAIHWSLGISSGVVYGALRPLLRRRGSGLLCGIAFWLLMDEAALTITGLTPPPQEFPWQTHMRGLIGHLVLGATIESAFCVSDAAGHALETSR
ncbi:MAG TPA: DUF1440 domain-containing protein [Thermoanaerobaculia bacterium]|nr:DUF1440 domain-containing protein [Thermoanaerobaculia bacterium]